MKKIIAAVVLVIVSIAIGIAAFATPSTAAYTPEQERIIAIMAEKDNLSAEETKEMLKDAQEACRTGRNIKTNAKLTMEQNALCLTLGNLDLIDMK